MPLDQTRCRDIVDTGRPLGSRAVGKQGRRHRRGIAMIDAIHAFSDAEIATRWLERTRWGDGPIVCPKCGSERGTRTKHPVMPFRCKDCRGHFSVKTGTPMADSKLPVTAWLIAAYQDLTNLKGVSSMKLSRDLDIGQEAAWYMLQRLHEAFMSDEPPAEFAEGGEFQVDEAYMGGLERNKHSRDRISGSQGGATKMIVICITHVPSGKVWADVITDTRSETVAEIVHRIVPRDGTVIYTDDARHYGDIAVERHAVNHGAGEYVRVVDLANGLEGTATTNHVESAWSMFRRSFTGVHHKMSPKHLRRYVKTFAGRWNIRELDTEDQMRWVVRAMMGREITWADLTADNGLPSGSGDGGAYFPERRKRYMKASESSEEGC